MKELAYYGTDHGQQTAVSPEKRYINQRLNIRMFYSEQLSVQPREKSMEEKARPIRDIMILKQIEEKQQRLKEIEINLAQKLAKNSGSPSANNTIDRSPTNQLTPAGYVIQAEVKQSGTPIDYQKEQARSQSVLLLDSQRNRKNIRIQQSILKNQSHPVLANESHNYDDDPSMSAAERVQQSKQKSLSALYRLDFNQPIMESSYLTNHDEWTSMLSTVRRNSMLPFKTQARQTVLNNSSQAQVHKLLPAKKEILQRHVEKRVPSIIQNPYKQIGSSFKLGNNDRFGEPYIQMRPANELSGPGFYNVPGAFPRLARYQSNLRQNKRGDEAILSLPNISNNGYA
ncbi:hypothetical protein FGO68_gene4438 [Halteria grandinella]|uniref:Uncharacterized protein n=1 Tax=Halteria grandinella TaxID=5974 RepID=A0A8J8P5W0_HALGN|nr:hypothetical protein FGO68_gene4438 [Halteria grandinella]